MLEIVICIIAFCLDGFCVSISFKMNKISIPFYSILIISSMNATFLCLSVYFSSYLVSFITYTRYLGSILYFMIAIYIYLSYRFKKINEKETFFISRIQGSVKVKDAIGLGFILSIDSLISGMVLVHHSYRLLSYFIIDFLFSIISIVLGIRLGNKIKDMDKFESEIFTSFVFLILAFIKLF